MTVNAAVMNLSQGIPFKNAVKDIYFMQVEAPRALFTSTTALKANFRSANLAECNFNKADLGGANFCLTNLQGASFKNASCPFGMQKNSKCYHCRVCLVEILNQNIMCLVDYLQLLQHYFKKQT